ncbi:MAG: hypothetical protein ABI551_19620, partial [Polyangiaceae bacterium]
MSTGNVLADTFVPLVASDVNKIPSGGAPAGLQNLAGSRFDWNGSAALTPQSMSQGNAFSPDAIFLTGNFTSSDEYPVQNVTAGVICGGQAFNISIVSAAWYRVLTSPNPLATLQQMFVPVSSPGGLQFMARVADDLGRFQYVVVCGVGMNGNQPVVEVSTATPVPLAQYGFVDGRLTINPVQTVRWEIRSLPGATYPQYAPLDPGPAAPPKYDLVREWVDSTNTVVGVPELIAEYAVDLKFAFTADIGTYTGVVPAPVLKAYDFDMAENQATAPLSITATTQSQRIRKVRIRLSTRSPMGDRGGLITAPDGYPMRYCTLAGGCTTSADSRDFARMRTMTTEVALPNQARLFY